ncbi:RluA family pseudouridine synthase [Candidatus Parcubacteria bacterium]|nr:RluA family pseudouridine synthase [Candidatus Parcubacteria bacterium]
MTKKTEIIIKSEQKGQRIDKFLSVFDSAVSRSKWQKIIKEGRILANNKEIKTDYNLKEDDLIRILPAKKKKEEKKEIPDVKILYEDADVIVLDKPAGVLSQDAPSSPSPSLTAFLLDYYPQIQNVGESENRCGIVHRLDKDTSGVIIVAKNEKSFLFLKKQFQDRKVQKIYIALVYGNVKEKEGKVELKIGRSKSKPNMQTVIDSKRKEEIKSREALTLYKVEKTFSDYTLLEVFPKTGRMHQIRVHLKAIGYPIVGDLKYYYKKYADKEPKLSRQFLHASELNIKLPSGKETTFRTDLAGDLQEFLFKIENNY